MMKLLHWFCRYWALFVTLALKVKVSLWSCEGSGLGWISGSGKFECSGARISGFKPGLKFQILFSKICQSVFGSHLKHMGTPFLPHTFPVHILKRCAKVGGGDFQCEEKRKKWRVELGGVQAEQQWTASGAATGGCQCLCSSQQALCLCWLKERLETPLLLLKLLNSQAQQAGGNDKFFQTLKFPSVGAGPGWWFGFLTAKAGACCYYASWGFYLSAVRLSCLGGLLYPCDENSFADGEYISYGWQSCALSGGPRVAGCSLVCCSEESWKNLISVLRLDCLKAWVAGPSNSC